MEGKRERHREMIQWHCVQNFAYSAPVQSSRDSDDKWQLVDANWKKIPRRRFYVFFILWPLCKRQFIEWAVINFDFYWFFIFSPAIFWLREDHFIRSIITEKLGMKLCEKYVNVGRFFGYMVEWQQFGHYKILCYENWFAILIFIGDKMGYQWYSSIFIGMIGSLFQLQIRKHEPHLINLGHSL